MGVPNSVIVSLASDLLVFTIFREKRLQRMIHKIKSGILVKEFAG